MALPASNIVKRRESALSYSPDHSSDDGVLRRLKWASFLCAFFLCVEVTGGLLSHSLAILSDAVHLGADLVSFIVAVIAANLARLPPTATSTYGYKRTEALAALFSMSVLAVASFFLGVEAIERIIRLSEAAKDDNGNFIDTSILVDGKLMSLIASIGVLVNVCLAFILGENHVHLPGADHDHSHSHAHHFTDNDHDHRGHSHGHEHTDDDSHSHDHSHADEDSHSHGHSHSHEHADDDSHSHSESIDHDDHHHQHHHSADSNERTVLLSDAEKGVAHDHSYTNLPTERKEKQRNINLHAAYLHVLTDLVQSILVLIAGIIIWKHPSMQIVDPICTILFCIFVAKSTAGVIVSSISVLMDQVPSEVNWEEVHDAICSVEGVSNVHMLHIWAISHGNNSLSVHADADDVEKALQALHEICRRFNISHSTIQLQPSHLNNCVTCGFKHDEN